MNIALVFAGGTGQRMNTKNLPKQFLKLHGKPIIIYTLEHFENHPDIDGIVLVCVDGWHDYMKKLLKAFQITKVVDVISGGRTGQDSIYNAVMRAKELYPDDSVVLMHDGVRPLIDEKLITDNIESVKKYGSAVTVSPAIETITVAGDEPSLVGQIIERQKCSLAKAPQGFFLGDIYAAHLKARDEGKHDFIDSASLMRYYGHPLRTVEGSPSNIKITTPTDFYIFRAIVDAMENEQIFGLDSGR